VDDEVDVECATALNRDSCLYRVMQSAAPVDGSLREDPGPLQDAKGVAVDGEYVPSEAVQQNAAGTFPRQAGETSEQPLRILVAHFLHEVQRQLARYLAYMTEQLADGPGLLSV
jgi:hypothetical protein